MIVLHTSLTVDAGELLRTLTFVSIDEVDTRTVVLTRVRQALINLCITISHRLRIIHDLTF